MVKIGFLIEQDPRLYTLQDMYRFQRLDEAQHEIISTPEDIMKLVAESADNPTIFEMGIVRHTLDGARIIHYFVLIVYAVGDERRMFTLSSWGGSYVSISQYYKDITEEQLQALIDDITTLEHVPIDFSRVNARNAGKDYPLLDISQDQLVTVRDTPMWQFFLDPDYGKEQLIRKDDFYRRAKLRVQGNHFYSSPELSSLLEYCKYKNPDYGRTELVVFKNVIPLLQTLMKEMFNRPRRSSSHRMVLTRAKKKHLISNAVIGAPKPTRKVTKWKSVSTRRTR